MPDSPPLTPGTPLRRSAPAKLNLGLHVLRRRPDGFHDIASVFVPIGWADEVSASDAHDLSLTCSDPALPTDGGNLVMQAASELRDRPSRLHGAALHLDKRVPYGAGLGSGSSDAAATLRLLDELWGLGSPDSMLAEIALGLGSDVPFFLLGAPALATGRGEVLTPITGTDVSASRPAGSAPWRCPFWLVVAVPPVHVPTGEAYALVTPNDAARPDLVAALVSNDLVRWRAELTNDFQAPVEAAFAGIAEARGALLDAGAGYASLSGSGSAVFGAFEREADARAAADGLRATCRVWVEPPGRPGAV